MPSGIYAGGEYLAPWCNVSHLSRDKLVYYAPRRSSGCVPCMPSNATLSRHELLRCDDSPFDRVKTLGWKYTDGHSVLIIVNPASGTGKSSATALPNVLDILKEAGILLEVQETKFPGHARDIIAALPLDALRSYDAILSVGGDGTLREVVDGLVLAARATNLDLSEAPAVAVIPSGSGNAIAASIGVTGPVIGALNVVHALRINKKSPMCVLKYVGSGGSPSISIGGCQWGIIADIDQGTEHLRWMGSTRFDVGAVGCILQKKSVSARVRLTLHPSAHENVTSEISRLRGKKGTPNPAAKVDDSDSSIVLEGDFITIVAWTAPYIGTDAKFCPFASATEADSFDVTLIRAGMNRMQMLGTMQSVQDGSFVTKSNHIDYFKVTKLEFEQINGDFLTIDGESEPVAPFTLEIAPESGRVRILNAIPFDPLHTLTK